MDGMAMEIRRRGDARDEHFSLETTTPVRQKKSDLRTEARRKALREVIDASGMKPSELARRAGLPSANLIYNFFSCHSSALTFDTYQRLANAIPGATVSMLAGAEIDRKS